MRTSPTVAALTVACVMAGCASTEPQVQTRPGTLLIGSARVSVNGVDVGAGAEVACSMTGRLVDITIGTGQSGVDVLVSTGDVPTARSVTIQNLGGFTGTYRDGFGERAEVTTTGRSFTITGTADGYLTSQPAIQTSGEFTVDVAC